MSKKQNIKQDLENGLVVNMIHDIARYGTSLRSRISEFREEGMKIEGRVVANQVNALEYYIEEAVEARKEINAILRLYPLPINYDQITTIYKDKNNSYDLQEIGSVKALELLKDGFDAVPF